MNLEEKKYTEWKLTKDGISRQRAKIHGIKGNIIDILIGFLVIGSLFLICIGSLYAIIEVPNLAKDLMNSFYIIFGMVIISCLVFVLIYIMYLLGHGIRCVETKGSEED